MHHSKREESSTKRGTVWVGQCRVNHYYGTTANQYAQLSADGLKPRFAFIFLHSCMVCNRAACHPQRDRLGAAGGLSR